MKHPLTLEAFVDWAGRKPADLEYNYADTNGCALFQFLKAQGMPVSSCGVTCWHDTDHQEHRMDERFRYVLPQFPWTFGAAARRARELLA